ncbi:hypothetical protein BD289DRAFT_432095 [Coniella lustricola]|uniref:Stress-response A/B barrel domain-containing protein n=1 Tax=Coniella lustricola TaxID=2025994 RepID=A0A2T3AA90_9PEZI|nr:hypothetical protein BD289DRAFT_432095 [Coniella lustricola]
MSRLIHRVTMFKLPGSDQQAQLLAAYDTLAKEQNKDGKPYIAYLCAGLSNPEDVRHKGYTLVAHSKFRSFEDMKFYDEQCAAHAALKKTVRELSPEEPPLTVYFEGQPGLDETHD